MSCNCKHSCNCVDPCSDTQIRRIVDDAVADRVEDMEGIASDAQHSAEDSATSASQSAQSAAQSQQFATTAGNNATSAAQSAQQAAVSATAAAESATAAVKVTTGLKQVADELTDTAKRLSDKVDDANQNAELAEQARDQAVQAANTAVTSATEATAAKTAAAASATSAQTSATAAQGFANTAQSAAVQTVEAAAGVKDKLDDWAVQYPAAVQQMNDAVASTSADAELAKTSADNAKISEDNAKLSADQAVAIATTLNSGVQGYPDEATLLAAVPTSNQLAVTMDTDKLFYWNGSAWQDLHVTLTNWVKDIGNLDSALNGTSVTWTDTTGKTRNSMAALDTALASFDVDSNKFTFADTTTALAEVPELAFFRTITNDPESEIAFTYWQKVNGAAVQKTTLSSGEATNELSEDIRDVALRTDGIRLGSRFPFEIIDKEGKQAFGIDRNGDTLVNGNMTVNGIPIKNTPSHSPYSFIISDKDNRVAFGIGKSGFVEIMGIRFSLVAGQNLVELIDKARRVAGGIRKSGEFFSNSSENPDTDPTYPFLDFAERMHVLVYGQSLSVGSWGIPVLGTSAPDSLMYNTGVRSYNQNPASLVALKESASGNQGETVCSGMAHDFVAKSGGMQGRKMIMNSSGVGGYAIEQLAKGTPPYVSMINQLNWVRNKMATEGTEYALDFLCWIQGETNMANGTSYSDYQTKFKQLRSDIQADTAGSRRVGRDLVALTYQTSSHGYYVGTPENPPEMIAQAQLDMALTDPLIDMWGPTYMQDPANYISGQGSVHHGPHGYRIQGLYAAKALRHRLRTRTADKPNGEKYLPVHATGARKLNDNTVLVDVFTYHPPLVIDASYVTELEDGMHGVELHDDTGRLPVTSVTIVGGNKIRVTTSAVIGSNPFIAFAWTPENRGEISNPGSGPRYASWFFGRVTGVRTTIHDSDPETTDLPDETGKPYPLYNYLPIQKIPVE